MSKLLPCFQCGSPACQPNPDWGSVIEYYGVSHQTVFVSCSQKYDSHCPVSISVEINADKLKNESAHKIEQIAADAWNALNAVK